MLHQLTTESIALLDQLIATPSVSRDEEGTANIIEEFLKARGYAIGPCGVDGFAGADTIKAMQKCLNEGRFK